MISSLENLLVRQVNYLTPQCSTLNSALTRHLASSFVHTGLLGRWNELPGNRSSAVPSSQAPSLSWFKAVTAALASPVQQAGQKPLWGSHRKLAGSPLCTHKCEGTRLRTERALSATFVLLMSHSLQKEGYGDIPLWLPGLALALLCASADSHSYLTSSRDRSWELRVSPPRGTSCHTIQTSPVYHAFNMN